MTYIGIDGTTLGSVSATTTHCNLRTRNTTAQLAGKQTKVSIDNQLNRAGAAEGRQAVRQKALL